MRLKVDSCPSCLTKRPLPTTTRFRLRAVWLCSTGAQSAGAAGSPPMRMTVIRTHLRRG